MMKRRFVFSLGAFDFQQPDIGRQRADLCDAAVKRLYRNRTAEQVFIVIEQFETDIAVGVRTAQQDVTGFALVIGQGKGRIFQQLDVTINEFRLATAALSFLAAMHQRDALTKRRVEHGFALFHFHLDAHRLEPNLMDLRFRHHLSLAVMVEQIWPEHHAAPGKGAAEAAPSGCHAQWQGLTLKPLR